MVPLRLKYTVGAAEPAKPNVFVVNVDASCLSTNRRVMCIKTRNNITLGITQRVAPNVLFLNDYS